MKVKRKGVYQYEGLEMHKDHSALVVPMAAEAFMLHGTNITRFIMNHENIYDFMLRAKVPRSSKLVMVDSEGNDRPLQNTVRYYMSRKGGKLIKVMPDGDELTKRIGINTDYNVTVCNNIADFNGDIDCKFYIEEAKKLVVQ